MHETRGLEVGPALKTTYHINQSQVVRIGLPITPDFQIGAEINY